MNSKKSKKILIAILTIALIAMYGYIPITPNAQAIDTIADARNLLSDSKPFVTGVTHTFTFTTGTTTPSGGYWLIDFPYDFTGLATSSLACGYGAANITEDAYNDKVYCRMAADRAATSTQVVITDVTSATTTGSKLFTIYNYSDSDELLERVEVRVFIIDRVIMTARVDSTLNFTISGINSGATVNGINCDQDTTSTSTPFGTLAVNATTTVCQRLNVTTNADDGYTVTVEQNHELLNDSGSNINSFNNSPDGTGTTTAEGWAAPLNVLDSYHTYGHMGLTSDDQDLASLGGYNDFYNSGGAAHYAGLASTSPMAVMHHDGPSDGTTVNVGQADVAYSAQIASLQESGDYENVLTYICTPIY